MARPDGATAAPAEFTDGQFEVLKWIAVVSMFIDHFGRHLLGAGVESVVFGAGRLAFPLFVFVLACNLARPGDRAARARRTSVRLAIACAVSTPAVIWARGDPTVVNVFGTLGLGAALCWVMAATGHMVWRVGACLLLCGAAGFVEFGLVGVCLLPAIYLWRAQHLREAAVFAVVLLLALSQFNGSFGGLYGYVGTLSVVPLAWAVARLPVSLPRMRWLFYVIYPLHMAVIGALNSAGLGAGVEEDAKARPGGFAARVELQASVDCGDRDGSDFWNCDAGAESLASHALARRKPRGAKAQGDTHRYRLERRFQHHLVRQGLHQRDPGPRESRRHGLLGTDGASPRLQ